MTWSQVPDPPADVARRSPIAPWALATVPLLVGFADPSSWRWWTVWALPLAIVLAALLGVGRRRPVLFVPAAAIGAAVLAASWHTVPGLIVAGIGTSGLVLWAWGLGVVALPAGRPSDPALHPAVAAAALGVATLLAGRLVVAAAVLAVGAALAALAVLVPEAATRLGARLAPLARLARAAVGVAARIVSAAADAVGRVVAAGAMVPVVVVVTVVWAIQRLTRHDALRSPAASGTDWSRRSGNDHAPLLAFSSVDLVDERPAPVRLARLAASVVALAVLAAVTIVVVDHRRSDPGDEQAIDRSVPTAAPTTVPTTGRCSTPPSEPILAAQPDAVALSCERLEAFAHATYRSSTGFRLADHRGSVVNIVDGERRTWAPPACSCPRLTVWWLGGSAAWGEGQRDLFTLPSMLAKAAWQDGIALDIRNFAMPTYTFNQEVHRLAELTTTETPPDLIVSYGGGNDLVFQALRASRGRAGDDSDIALLEQTFDDVLRHGIPVDPSKIEWTPDPQAVDESGTSEELNAVVTATADRYRRNLGLADRIAGSIDRPMVAVWQPLLAGSPAAAGQPGVVPEQLLAAFTTIDDDVRSQLPDQVIDLGATFQDTDHPVFFDLFHTGEDGAAIAAGVLYARLRASIDAARAAADRRAADGGPRSPD